MTDEQQIAALRKEIRRAGETTLIARLFIFPIGPFVFLMALGIVALTTHIEWLPSKALWRVLDWGMGFAGAWVLGNLLRGRHARRLRSEVAALPPSQRAELLLPLRRQFGDTGQLARTLIRELHLT